jgi:hypothetical protein
MIDCEKNLETLAEHLKGLPLSHPARRALNEIILAHKNPDVDSVVYTMTVSQHGTGKFVQQGDTDNRIFVGAGMMVAHALMLSEDREAAVMTIMAVATKILDSPANN